MPRPCSLCSSSEKSKLASKLIAAGETDGAIAQRLGVGRMAVHRHRHTHVLAPARALVEAAGKDAPARQQRAEIQAAAEAGDPLAFISLANIVGDLRRTQERLERTAAMAEAAGQGMAVAGLSGQQLRAAEVRARLGGHDRPQPAASAAGPGAGVSIQIFLGGEEAEPTTITIAGEHAAPADLPLIDVVPQAGR